MAVQTGDIAPDFELPNQFGEPVRLSGYRGVKPVALVFFPLAFSGTCTGELCELRDNIGLFADASVELIGVSVDSKWALRAFADAEGFDFPLLSDFWPHGDTARAYDVFLPERGYAGRSTFLIDEAGVVAAKFETAPGEPRPLAAYREALGRLGARGAASAE